MKSENQVTFFEGVSLITITFLFYLCDQTLPELSASTGNSGWISQILNFVIIFGVFSLYMVVLRRFDGKDFTQILEEVLGKFFAKIIFILIFLFLFLITALMLSKFVSLLNTYSYPMEKKGVMTASLLIAPAVCVFYPFKGLARVASICMPIAIASIYITLLVAYNQYTPTILTPILGYGVMPIIKSSFNLFSTFNLFIIFPLFASHFGTAKDLSKIGKASIGIAGGTLILMTLCYNMATPYNNLQSKASGLLELSQSRYISRFFQRFESLFLMLYMLALLVIFSITLYAIKMLYTRIFAFPQEREKDVVLPLVFVLICATQLFAYYYRETEIIRKQLNKVSFLFSFGLVLIVLIVSLLRKKGKGKGLRNIAMLLLPCLLCGVFSGCQPYREPDEEVVTLMIGYDKGETERFKITMKFLIEAEKGGKSSAQGESDSQGNPNDVFTMDTESIVSMVDELNTVIAKHISLVHTKVIVISEELARENVEDIITPINHYTGTKSNMAVIICKDSAQEYIESEGTKLYTSLPMKLEMLMQRQRGTSAYDVLTVSNFYNTIRSKYGSALALYSGVSEKKKKEKEEAKSGSGSSGEADSAGGKKSTMGMGKENQSANPGAETKQPEKKEEDINTAKKTFREGFLPGEMPIKGSFEIELAGMAVFHGVKMVGELNTRETASYSILNSSLYDASYSVKDLYDEKCIVAFNADSRGKTKVKTWFDQNGVPNIHIISGLRLKTLMVQNTEVNYSLPEESKKLLAHAKDAVEKDMMALIEKTQKELNVDVLQLGRHVSKHFLTIQEWEQYNWPEHYKDAIITVDCDLMLS